ncbi:MAG: hypothetical protein K9M44_00540 [Candidatus Pacebacteria bacterium]|nr:hypothetical protein [Candidatus Paceibacterota bacterium]
MKIKMNLKKGLVLSITLAMLFSVFSYSVSASTDSSDLTLILAEAEADESDDVNLDDFTESELLEPEPSDLPEVKEDVNLTNRLKGSLLLDVEGNGEVYYVDPDSEGKEYLADGASAHRLLERRALGINEVNFSKLELGSEANETNVCANSELASRLKGKIVLRVESHGEAYWINPNNCRAYYTGTYEAAYNLMKKMSLGIKKANLAKIKDNVRQKAKTAFRHSVYAYAAENEIDLKQAKDEVKNDLKDINDCLKVKQALNNQALSVQNRLILTKECSQGKIISSINEEKREKIKEAIEAVRNSNREAIESEGEESVASKPSLGQMIKNIIKPGTDSNVQ